MKKVVLVLFLGLFSALMASEVVFETTQGKIVFALKPEIAPKACENFEGLVKKGYYDGISFHRIIKGFMIQGGDPTGTGRGGQSIYGQPFEDEFKPNVMFNKAGILAMANAGRNTNGSQFFITTVATPHLNGRHTIFGEVVEGMDVVKKLENVTTDGRDMPMQPQKIIKAYLK
jgi:peptidylprolyl isomerase